MSTAVVYASEHPSRLYAFGMLFEADNSRREMEAGDASSVHYMLPTVLNLIHGHKGRV